MLGACAALTDCVHCCCRDTFSLQEKIASAVRNGESDPVLAGALKQGACVRLPQTPDTAPLCNALHKLRTPFQSLGNTRGVQVTPRLFAGGLFLEVRIALAAIAKSMAECKQSAGLAVVNTPKNDFSIVLHIHGVKVFSGPNGPEPLIEVRLS